MRKIIPFLLMVVLLSSCVSKKKYTELQTRTSEELTDCKDQLLVAKNDLKHAQDRLKDLEEELSYVKENNTNMLDRLADLSVISKEGAASIKESLKAINDQNLYIQDLHSTIRSKDSLNLALVTNLKRSLADVNDEDVQIEVKKGVVYISLSDKMLFKTASSQIQPAAKNVLGKIAKVVKDHQKFDILVEGHTDSVPIRNECVKDNWDLSVMRATSVVRTLQQDYGVEPGRMTAGGRGEYVPKASNETVEGRSTNRRTEIIILPKLDEFFSLLEENGAEE